MTTAQNMQSTDDKKRVLQPNEGQLLSFKDEELRPALQKVASRKHKEILEEQIRENK
jgi:hypothetical protein